MANEVRDLGVIGIGMGGSEQLFPPEPFEKVYAEARRLGLHTTAHAGEAAGTESIWGAIRTLQIERIGHGVRAIEDEKLLDALVRSQLPLELCPLSNVCTGVVRSIDHHPSAKCSSAACSSLSIPMIRRCSATAWPRNTACS